MDTKNLERALTKFFATALNLTADSTIFRGGIPTSKDEGAAVILGSEITSNNPAIKRYNVQIIGKYNDADTAKQLIEDISNALPCYEHDIALTGATITIRALLKRGSGGTWNDEDNGKKKTFCSFNLIACF